VHELPTVGDLEAACRKQVPKIHRAPGIEVLIRVVLGENSVVSFTRDDKYSKSALFQDSVSFKKMKMRV
jgi:hypothetical protein